jgi:hypothetical protein
MRQFRSCALVAKVSAAQSKCAGNLFRLAKIVASESAAQMFLLRPSCNVLGASRRRYWCLRTRRLCEEVTKVAPVNKERAVYKERPTESAEESAAVGVEEKQVKGPLM